VKYGNLPPLTDEEKAALKPKPRVKPPGRPPVQPQLDEAKQRIAELEAELRVRDKGFVPAPETQPPPSEPLIDKRWTKEDIQREIERLAGQSEDPASQRWALNKLSNREGEETFLDPPKTDFEIIQTMARMMKGVGNQLVHLAYHEAWPKSGRELGKSEPRLKRHQVPINHADLPSSLRALRKAFPELRSKGMPRGFPVRGSISQQVEWCKNVAIDCILERKARAAEIDADEGAVRAPQPDPEARATEEGPRP
jgi:hypothetical protein